MGIQWRYVLGGAGLAALSFVIGLEVEIATARPGADPTFDRTLFDRTLFDRTLKGDRLAPSLRPSVTPIQPPKLLDGCESSISTIRNSAAREIVGRCVAAAPAGTRLG